MNRTSMTACMAACLAALLLTGCGSKKDSFKPASIEVDRPYIYPEPAPAKAAPSTSSTAPKAATPATGTPPAKASTSTKASRSAKAPRGSRTAFALMRIRNKGGTADRLLRVSSPKSGPVQMQRTYVIEGNPIQRTVQGIDIPAGGSVEMSTSGYFLRFERVSETFKDGGTFQIVLEFMVAGKLPVTVATDTIGPGLPQPAPKDADGDPIATGAPISIQGLESGQYGTEATGPAPKKAAATGTSSAGASTPSPANLSKPSS